MSDYCNRCGGGIDGDHPTTCSACLYELFTGRNYQADVDAAQRVGMRFTDYARRFLAAAHPEAPTP